MSNLVRTEKRVTYYLPGAVSSEDITRVIEDGPNLVERAAAAAPGEAFCFTLQTVLTADPIDDGQGGTLTVVPRVVDRSGRYYLGGTVYTPDELELIPGDYRILIANARGNGWRGAIQTPLGNWQPFEDGDTRLDPVA
jgi:hypothetical protein